MSPVLAALALLLAAWGFTLLAAATNAKHDETREEVIW